MDKNQGYDRIAFSYDFVAGFFSFNQINKSQLAFLSHLSDRSTCLILGGGTGYFLQQLLEIHSTIQVTYVDASVKMIAAAKQRIQKKIPAALDRVAFICKEVESFEWQKYDVIVCNYFLDLFDPVYIKVLAGKFKQHLHSRGVVYITDFHINESHRVLRWSTILGLKILYCLHKCIIKTGSSKLSEIETIMVEHNFLILRSKDYLKGILKCSLYGRIY